MPTTKMVVLEIRRGLYFMTRRWAMIYHLCSFLVVNKGGLKPYEVVCFHAWYTVFASHNLHLVNIVRQKRSLATIDLHWQDLALGC